MGEVPTQPRREILRHIPLLFIAVALGACTPEAPVAPKADATPQAATPTPAPPALAAEAEGLRLFNPATGSSRPIPFGTAQAQTLAALAYRGAPETGTNGECGAGPLDYARWPDGLHLWFQEGVFLGWAIDDRTAAAIGTTGAVGTAAGIAPGSTRADLDSAYAATVEETTLGTEFAAGELFGLLDGAGQGAKVTNMWAGVSCNFR